jgi:hypothetical protein
MSNIQFQIAKSYFKQSFGGLYLPLPQSYLNSGRGKSMGQISTRACTKEIPVSILVKSLFPVCRSGL